MELKLDQKLTQTYINKRYYSSLMLLILSMLVFFAALFSSMFLADQAKTPEEYKAIDVTVQAIVVFLMTPCAFYFAYIMDIYSRVARADDMFEVADYCDRYPEVEAYRQGIINTPRLLIYKDLSVIQKWVRFENGLQEQQRKEAIYRKLNSPSMAD